MGLFDKLRSSEEENDGQNSEKIHEEGDNPKIAKVNVGGRAEIIEEYYDVSKEGAEFVAKVLKQSIEEGSIETYEAIDRIKNHLDVSDEKAWDIRDTEFMSITTQYKLEDIQSMEMDLNFEWASQGCSPICDEVESITSENHAGNVEELKEMLRREAEKHPEGTPDRVDHWVPHHGCMSTIITSPE